jgi:hypothetical protein
MPRGRFNANAPSLPEGYVGWTNPACSAGSCMISPTAKKHYNLGSQKCYKEFHVLTRRVEVSTLMDYWRKHGYVKVAKGGKHGSQK